MSRGGLPSDPRPATVSRDNLLAAGRICRRATATVVVAGQLAFGCQLAADSAAAGAGERTRDPLPGVAQ